MVLDSSAIVAILNQEPDCDRLVSTLVTDPTPLISEATLTEVSIVVLSARGEAGLAILDEFLQDWAVETVPVTVDHSRLAIAAYQRFGKGRHPAGLNFGDVFSYALAKATGQPLLYKGADFSQTDLR